MSKSLEKPSDAASDRQGASSVYDFLYYDARRVGSYLAQLENFGLLESVEQSQSSGEDTSTKSTLTAAAGVPVVGNVAKADEKGGADRRTEALSRKYDPFWLNALDLYERLDAAGILKRSLSEARIGSMVAVSGGLWVMDTTVMKTFAADPVLQKALLNTTAAPSGPRQAKAAAASSQQMGIAMLKLLPHGIQARLISEQGALWASLDASGLTTPAEDLLLKHGVRIAGSWTMVGILDAVPEIHETEFDLMMSSLTSASTLGDYLGGLAGMAEHARPLIGRPDGAYGITPLLIFREIVS